MRLDEYEMHFLYAFLSRIDITLISEEHFLIATILHERLKQALMGRKAGLS